MTKGELIKAQRIEKGLSLIELGKKCGIRDTTLRKYEKGERNPKHETLEIIAAGLGCSVRDLIPTTMHDGHLAFDSAEDFEIYHESLTNDVLKAVEEKRPDTEYMKKLSVPALKLNETGRKVLLDNAETLAANEDMTK